jgi:hypothetical protein
MTSALTTVSDAPQSRSSPIHPVTLRTTSSIGTYKSLFLITIFFTYSHSIVPGGFDVTS